MTRRLALLTTVLALALAPAARAQENPFGPIPPAQPTATPAPTVTPPATDDGGTGRATLFLIGAVLIVGFGAMGWFILRDARRAAPDAEPAGGPRLREEGPHRHQRQAKAKARAKTRAQRAARKKNR